MAKIYTTSYLCVQYINTPNLANYSPYELVFGRKPKPLLNLETMPGWEL